RRQVEFRLEGRPQDVIDDGGPLHSSVRAIWAPTGGSTSGAAVLVPAIYPLRFSGKPDAMAALLAHETAHHVNRDIVLLSTLRRLIAVISIVGIGFFALQLAASVRADASAGESWWVGLWAAIIGKSYSWLGAGTVLLVLAGIRSMLERAREALADAAAQQA